MMDLYREEILDHYQNPRNYHRLTEADREAGESNPLCGDHQIWQLRLDNSKRITEVAFTGEGCALSIASASLMSEYLKGKKLSQLEQLQAEDVFNIVGFRSGPARAKCILLPLEVLRRLNQTNT